MKKLFSAAALLAAVISASPAHTDTEPEYRLLLSEISPSADGGDWVELFLYSESETSVRISSLLVTMYYGTNEQLASDPVTLYSYDRPETPWDDRFAVVHLTGGGTDETDLTGDSSGNAVLDLYCSNYSGSLWNGDCAAAIDTDDDPDNGMIDFLVYSDGNGSFNSTILEYLELAAAAGQWNSSLPESSVTIPEGGVKANQVICRKIPSDTGSSADWFISDRPTPGRENTAGNSRAGSKLFKLARSSYQFIPQKYGSTRPVIPVIINMPCDITLRVFTDTGILVYESPLQKNRTPGRCALPADIPFSRTRTGLYIGLITAVSSANHSLQNERFVIVISRY